MHEKYLSILSMLGIFSFPVAYARLRCRYCTYKELNYSCKGVSLLVVQMLHNIGLY
jgi:hypothetical protein